MHLSEETQAVCGFTLSVCSYLIGHALAWAPVLQVIAMLVAITSGVFAIAVSVKKLRSDRHGD